MTRSDGLDFDGGANDCDAGRISKGTCIGTLEILSSSTLATPLMSMKKEVLVDEILQQILHANCREVAQCLGLPSLFAPWFSHSAVRRWHLIQCHALCIAQIHHMRHTSSVFPIFLHDIVRQTEEGSVRTVLQGRRLTGGFKTGTNNIIV